jgi:hypothetical protein
MMEQFNGCQLPNLVNIAEGKAAFGPQPFKLRVKRLLARPWNYYVKKNLKKAFRWAGKTYANLRGRSQSKPETEVIQATTHLQAGDRVRVKSKAEIEATLNRFKELKGCAFLQEMWQYCDTTQRVHKVMERFLDERDYQVKKVRGIVLLDGVFCPGTPVFGRCDRSCHFFWREEWLEKIED